MVMRESPGEGNVTTAEAGKRCQIEENIYEREKGRADKNIMSTQYTLRSAEAALPEVCDQCKAPLIELELELVFVPP
jgi:hypothetical protein